MFSGFAYISSTGPWSTDDVLTHLHGTESNTELREVSGFAGSHTALSSRAGIRPEHLPLELHTLKPTPPAVLPKARSPGSREPPAWDCPVTEPVTSCLVEPKFHPPHRAVLCLGGKMASALIFLCVPELKVCSFTH